MEKFTQEIAEGSAIVLKKGWADSMQESLKDFGDGAGPWVVGALALAIAPFLGYAIGKSLR